MSISSGAMKIFMLLVTWHYCRLAQILAICPVVVDPQNFVRVAAPTGSAAFQIRFNATTIHRLIHWFRPPHFAPLTNDKALAFLQKHLSNTQLIILDEISMVGRQMMGRIDSRTTQGTAGRERHHHDFFSLTLDLV